jgi:hypothetical protein
VTSLFALPGLSVAVLKLALTLFAVPSVGGAAPPLSPKQKLACAPPAVTSLDHPFALRCSVAPALGAASVVLYYRQGGAPDFTAAPALRTKPGAYAAALCAHDVVAGPLQYYFEAVDQAGKTVANDGDEDSPSVLVVAPATPVARPVAVAIPAAGVPAAPMARPTIGDDNDPLALVRQQQDDNRRADVRARRRQVGPMVGFALGLGYGYYGERTLDFNRDLASDPSTGSSGLPLVMPEVGWQVSDDLTLSAQLRWQQLNPEGAGDPRLGSPAKHSWAAVARAQYQLGEGRLRPFVGANVGYGDGFRVVVPANPRAQLLRDDTIRGGPFVLGPSGGALYHFSRYAALVAELRVLAGVPNFATVGELSVGMQFGFL